ncbi:MAG: anti-sigma factor [Verrucomicrobia bacterium]|nr:anti-sigma factor [Verrucomicrobiota bacterium]
MSFEELENLAIAYLLDELGESERSAFEHRMAKEHELAKLVDDLERSMGLAIMASTDLVEPSADLRDRLLDAIPEDESLSATVNEPTSENKVVPFPVLKATLAVVGWAAAACLAIVYLNQRENFDDLQTEKSSVIAENVSLQSRVGELSEAASANQARIEELSSSMDSALAENVSLQSRVGELSEAASASQARNEELSSSLDSALATNESLRAQLDQLSVQLVGVNVERDNLESIVANLRQQTVLDKVQIAALSSEIDELRYGFAVWDTEGDRGIVKVFNLQALDIPTQDYQFWVISPDQEAPIPAGVFQVDEQGRAEYAFAPTIPVTSVGAFAISLEPKGGSSSPTGPIVLSGAL